MKKVIRLTESDLFKIVKRVLSEQSSNKININPKGLKFGDGGSKNPQKKEDVILLQKELIDLGFLKTTSMKPTGYFGKLTQIALNNYNKGNQPVKKTETLSKDFKDINSYPSCVRFQNPNKTKSKDGQDIYYIEGTGFYEGYYFYNNNIYTTKSKTKGTYSCNKEGKLILDIVTASKDNEKLKSGKYQYSPRIDAEIQHIKNRKMDDTPFFVYDPKDNLIYLFNTGGVYVASSSVVDGADVQKKLEDNKIFSLEDWCKNSVDRNTGKKLLPGPYKCTNPDTGKFHQPNYDVVSNLKSRFLPKGIYTIKGLKYKEGYAGGSQGNVYDLKPIRLEGTITAEMEKQVSPAIHGIPKIEGRLRASADLQNKLQEDLNKGKVPQTYINDAKAILNANQSYGCVGVPESFVNNPKVYDIVSKNVNKIKVFAMGESNEDFLVKKDGQEIQPYT